MDQVPTSACSTGAAPVDGQPGPSSQLAMLDIFFPGFSGISSLLLRLLGIDLNVYIPTAIMLGALVFSWSYVSDYFKSLVSQYLMSSVEIRVDDEIYNIIMAWVAAQKFAKSSRFFVVNTNLTSRNYHLWKWDHEESDDTDDGELSLEQQKKTLSYTPSFGSHTFWYRGRLLLFERSENREQVSFGAVSERERISIKCFGRSPWILKELLYEAKLGYMKKDSKKTLIYRGTCRGMSPDPSWQRSMTRVSRPLSTVILSEATKKKVVDDLTDYLRPATRRWYSNRGIPYRRGYLLYGPPGTGKSSLSLALAGHFNMRIYIVSLNSISSSEENLSSLFAELPKRCVVLLEDIDTAGLTNTREEVASVPDSEETKSPGPAQLPTGTTTTTTPAGRLSLSGLLNILDGVASQEGRILIMTTNHLEKLDKALIRPGRVDMMIEFGRADHEMAVSIFTAIFATLDADEPDKPDTDPNAASKLPTEKPLVSREVSDSLVGSMAHDFAAKIPEHEFSPAEIQGYLLTHKRSPADAVSKVEDWVVDTRKQKKEKELKEAEERRKAREKELKEVQEKKEKELKETEEKDKRGAAEEAASAATRETGEARAAPASSESKETPPAEFAGVGGDEAASAPAAKAPVATESAHSADAPVDNGTGSNKGCCCSTASDGSSDTSLSQPPTPTEIAPAPVAGAGMEKGIAANLD